MFYHNFGVIKSKYLKFIKQINVFSKTLILLSWFWNLPNVLKKVPLFFNILLVRIYLIIAFGNSVRQPCITNRSVEFLHLKLHRHRVTVTPLHLHTVTLCQRYTVTNRYTDSTLHRDKPLYRANVTPWHSYIGTNRDTVTPYEPYTVAMVHRAISDTVSKLHFDNVTPWHSYIYTVATLYRDTVTPCQRYTVTHRDTVTSYTMSTLHRVNVTPWQCFDVTNLFYIVYNLDETFWANSLSLNGGILKHLM